MLINVKGLTTVCKEKHCKWDHVQFSIQNCNLELQQLLLSHYPGLWLLLRRYLQSCWNWAELSMPINDYWRWTLHRIHSKFSLTGYLLGKLQREVFCWQAPIWPTDGYNIFSWLTFLGQLIWQFRWQVIGINWKRNSPKSMLNV